MGQSIENDRRALEAEGAVKIREIEVDFEQFEVSARSAAVTPFLTQDIPTKVNGKY